MRPATLVNSLYRALNNHSDQRSQQWIKSLHLICGRNASSLTVRNTSCLALRSTSNLTVRTGGMTRCGKSARCIASMRVIDQSWRRITQQLRGIAYDTKLNKKVVPELSMNNAVFKEFVNHLVENKLLAPRYHSMLTLKVGEYELRVADLLELSKVLDEDGDVEDEFRQLARLDLASCEEAKPLIENDIIDITLKATKDDCDDAGVDKSRTTVEFEGGAGGQESMIFNGEIFEMYQKFANYRGWSFEVKEREGEPSGHGSFALSRASAEVQGKDAYDILKFEAGVHRVQRVPVTEKKGKLQTSTCVVIVTPTIKNPQIELKPQDLKFEYFRSSGSGGQAVNVTNSAVRVTHLPSGLTVECQEMRAQFQNQDIAVERIRERLFAREREQIMESNQKQRRVQIGTRDRSEKIRTYNFQQGRVTDHRIGYTVAGTPEKLLEGGALLKELIDSVSLDHRKEILLERLKQFQEGRL